MRKNLTSSTCLGSTMTPDGRLLQSPTRFEDQPSQIVTSLSVRDLPTLTAEDSYSGEAEDRLARSESLMVDGLRNAIHNGIPVILDPRLGAMETRIHIGHRLWELLRD